MVNHFYVQFFGIFCLDPISHLLCNDIFSGSEVEVVPDLLLTGAFAHIDTTMVEWHGRLAKSDDRKKLSTDLKVYREVKNGWYVVG